MPSPNRCIVINLVLFSVKGALFQLYFVDYNVTTIWHLCLATGLQRSLITGLMLIRSSGKKNSPYKEVLAYVSFLGWFRTASGVITCSKTLGLVVCTWSSCIFFSDITWQDLFAIFLQPLTEELFCNYFCLLIKFCVNLFHVLLTQI